MLKNAAVDVHPRREWRAAAFFITIIFLTNQFSRVSLQIEKRVVVLIFYLVNIKLRALPSYKAIQD
jgi:hypothetical protein